MWTASVCRHLDTVSSSGIWSRLTGPVAYSRVERRPDDGNIKQLRRRRQALGMLEVREAPYASIWPLKPERKKNISRVSLIPQRAYLRAWEISGSASTGPHPCIAPPAARSRHPVGGELEVSERVILHWEVKEGQWGM